MHVCVCLHTCNCVRCVFIWPCPWLTLLLLTRFSSFLTLTSHFSLSGMNVCVLTFFLCSWMDFDHVFVRHTSKLKVRGEDSFLWSCLPISCVRGQRMKAPIIRDKKVFFLLLCYFAVWATAEATNAHSWNDDMKWRHEMWKTGEISDTQLFIENDSLIEINEMRFICGWVTHWSRTTLGEYIYGKVKVQQTNPTCAQ